jgi:undecaprenyl phosphate-alpha-L-ara4N flippase subunit ArnE
VGKNSFSLAPAGVFGYFKIKKEVIMKLILLMTLVSGMLAGGQFMLKTGFNKIGGFSMSNILQVFTNAWVLGGIAMIGSQMLLWFWILSRYDLTKAYPLISMSYIFAMVLAVLLLKEQPGAIRIIGTLLIVAGVALVAR